MCSRLKVCLVVLASKGNTNITALSLAQLRVYAAATMLSLRFKSRRRECGETHLPRVAPRWYTGAQRNSQARSLEDQNVAGPHSDAATSSPQTRNAIRPLVKMRNRKFERAGKPSRPYVTHCLETSQSAETDELKLKVPVFEEEVQNELQGRNCGGEGSIQKKKRKKGTLDQQEQDLQQQEKLACSPSEPERKRNRQGDAQQPNDKSPHLKSSKLSKSAPLTPSDAESRQLQQKLNKDPQADSRSEHDQEDKRPQLLQKFAARGMSGKGTLTLRERLHGGQFRSLNEFLYTKKGAEAWARFRCDPKLFDLVSPAGVPLVPVIPLVSRI